MAVTAVYEARLRVTESLTLGLDKAPDPSIVHEIVGKAATLNATSLVPATQVFSDSRTLAAGVDALDLTALPRGNLANLNLTGLKVQLLMIAAAAANTDKLTIKQAGTNPYPIFGSATGELVLDGGDFVFLHSADNLADVSGTVKSIAITSPDADAIYEIVLVAG